MMPRSNGWRGARASDAPRSMWWRRLAGATLVAALALSLPATVPDARAAPSVDAVRSLSLGDRVTGSLGSNQSLFPFEALAGTKVRLAVRPRGSLRVNLTVIGPDGEPVGGLTRRILKRGRLLQVSGVLPDAGRHAIMLESANGSSGTYALNTYGRPPSRVVIRGNAGVGGERNCAFPALAGSRLRAITVRRNARTLELSEDGVLMNPDGQAVALRTQQAMGGRILARGADLAMTGVYDFRFTPTGTGPYTAVVRLDPPPADRHHYTLPNDAPALPPVVGNGAQLRVSTPPNGTHLVAGDEAWVTVVLRDDEGDPLALGDLSTANLYVYGPQAQALTTTAVDLLGASTDRNARPHHYIDLRTHPDVVMIDGNTLAFPLNAVTDELPGTYTATFWGRLAADALQQWMPAADFQIKTPVVETQIVERERCGACHLGSLSGKYYLHHIDPGSTSPGNPSLDLWPVRTCKSCHNQDGYAAYRNGGRTGDSNLDRTADPIVRRVHGVHMGADLKDPFNNDPDTGDFRDFVHVEFPADVKDCTKCHVDDRWKTNPSRQACGTCHDNVWFGASAETPFGWQNHSGGQVTVEASCNVCHPPDVGGMKPVAVAHEIVPPRPAYVVALDMTRPDNDTHYVAGEAPLVTIVLEDAETLEPIDHGTIDDENFSRVYLFVSGPRAATKPVLTTAARGLESARASIRSTTDETWNLGGDPTLVVDVDGQGPLAVTADAGLFANPEAATMAEVIAWLNLPGPAGLGDVATASSYTSRGARKVVITSNTRGGTLEILPSDVAATVGWSVGVHDPPPATYARNDLRDLADDFGEDPRVTRFGDRLEYQLDDVAGLSPGTYTLFVYARPSSGATAYALTNFQVGTKTAEAKPAAGCTDCHGDTRMHGTYPFDPDYCKNCHDYEREGTGSSWTDLGGDSTSGWSGFGAMPLSKRVHGVHRGHYLQYPEEVKPTHDYSGVIFPQDIRNCTKCHSENSTWTQKPSRLACLACHDSDAARSHGRLMTYDPTPTAPWNGDEEESCRVCHGEDRDFPPSAVHNVWDPYAPPYPREAE